MCVGMCVRVGVGAVFVWLLLLLCCVVLVRLRYERVRALQAYCWMRGFAVNKGCNSKLELPG